MGDAIVVNNLFADAMKNHREVVKWRGRKHCFRPFASWFIVKNPYWRGQPNKALNREERLKTFAEIAAEIHASGIMGDDSAYRPFDGGERIQQRQWEE